MLNVRPTTRFRRDLRRARRQRRNFDLLNEIIRQIAEGTPLAPRHRDHDLSGDWERYRERHVTADWLLIYRTTDAELILARLGTHSELF